jgi:hypothetical protein
MKKSFVFAIASLLAAASPLAWSSSANAQQPAAGGAPAATKAAAPAPRAPAANDAQDAPATAEDQGRPWPVILVTSVEVLRSSRDGGMDVVRARGLVTSSAWSSPHLLPINSGVGLDGVLELIFQATPPTSPSPLEAFMPIEAMLPIAEGHPYKAIRVRSGTNAITLKTLPGYAEIKTPENDCSKCLGKYFLAKGATAPAGVPAGDIVREADLPWTLRIIRPTDGIADYIADPNRLTLILSEDGRIADAGWD